MKRIPLSLLLILALLAALITPIFATDALPEETEGTETAVLTGDSLPEESTPILEAGPSSEENAVDEAEKTNPETRAPDAMSTSAQGISFIKNFTGKTPGSQQLAAAEDAVNAFIKRDKLSLNQAQFDALVDFVIEKGPNMFKQGYRCETVISKGDYTDAELADAFCAWVKDGAGYFSESNLARRLRQIKLFLYGSYDGICYAKFRYVIYNANGGTLSDNTVMCYTYESTFAELPVATRNGYYFGGWYTAPTDGSHLCNGFQVSGNYKVYAHWSKEPVNNPNDPKSGETQTGPGSDPDTTPGSETGAGVTTYPNHPEWPKLAALKISEAGVQFIKTHEGFAEKPMWDYGQYSVGYGSNAANAPIPISNPITMDEADYLLRYYLASFENQIDPILEKGSVEHTQAQYDAIISLSYNLGLQWVNKKYNVYQNILFGGCTETDFVNALGSWCSAGGTVLSGLCKRRMEEADLYWNGDYTLNNSQYRCLVFNAAGGSASDNVEYYRAGNKLGSLPTATKYGYYLAGWFDKTNGGNQFTVDSEAPTAAVTYLFAHWTEGTDPNPDPNPNPNPNPNDSDFIDVKSTDWYYTWVTKAAEAKLFGGVSKNEFAPNTTMTRAMLVTVLYRMAGSPTVSATPKFTDVPTGEWYTDAVIWASENGIVNGISETEFAPNDNLLRQQLATMLLRYATVFKKTDTAARKELTSFSDNGKIADYALDAMQWSVYHEIIGGSDGLLLPDGNATRAQCAKMLVVFMELAKS